MISNQHFDIGDIDIEVLVDTRQVFRDNFPVKTGGDLAQHHWKHHTLLLDHGKHIVEVRSQKAHARLKKTIDVNISSTITIAFWQDKKTNVIKGFFTIDYTEAQTGTM